MFDQLRNMFPDKEALKKKLAAIEKNVSSILLSVFKRICLTKVAIFGILMSIDQKLVRYAHCIAKFEARRRIWYVHQKVRGPRQLRQLREEHHQPTRPSS